MSLQETAFGRVALPVISNEHNRIHGGSVFTAQVANDALGAGSSLYIEINIPEGIEVHLKSTLFYTGDDSQFELIEAPTLTSGVTLLTSYNRKRISPVGSHLILKSNPTSISGGTLLDNVFVKGAVQNPGLLVVSDWEWILKEDEVYLLRLTNEGVSSEQALLKADWYEEVE